MSLSKMITIKDEIYAHRSLAKCDNALHLNRVYEGKKNIYLVLDYQEGGNLHDFKRKNPNLSEKDLQEIIA